MLKFKFPSLLSLILISCAQTKEPEIIFEPIKYSCPPPKTIKEEVYPLDEYTYILGESETLFNFIDDDFNRSKNIELAVNKINNTSRFLYFKPGEIFSYNKLVGIRTKDAGFLDAPVISGGEIIKDTGGGVCQVSSTIFSAAVFSGLKILERTAHSRPSSYIGMGLDSTVMFPEVCAQKNKFAMILI